jgi:hypothetical protein
VLLLELEHGGECGYMYGLGWNGINNFNFLGVKN